LNFYIACFLTTQSEVRKILLLTIFFVYLHFHVLLTPVLTEVGKYRRPSIKGFWWLCKYSETVVSITLFYGPVHPINCEKSFPTLLWPINNPSHIMPNQKSLTHIITNQQSLTHLLMTYPQILPPYDQPFLFFLPECSSNAKKKKKKNL